MQTQQNEQLQNESPRYIDDMDYNVMLAKDQQHDLDIQFLRLKEKELDGNLEIASKNIEISNIIISNLPKEHRKTVTTYAAIGAIFLLICMSFLAYCLYFNYR